MCGDLVDEQRTAFGDDQTQQTVTRGRGAQTADGLLVDPGRDELVDGAVRSQDGDGAVPAADDGSAPLHHPPKHGR